MEFLSIIHWFSSCVKLTISARALLLSYLITESATRKLSSNHPLVIEYLNSPDRLYVFIVYKYSSNTYLNTLLLFMEQESIVINSGLIFLRIRNYIVIKLIRLSIRTILINYKCNLSFTDCKHWAYWSFSILYEYFNLKSMST